MSSTINDVRVAPGESAEAKRERRLQRRRERERAHRASETAEQREERLSRIRIRDRARRAALYAVHTPHTRSGSPHNVWHFSSNLHSSCTLTRTQLRGTGVRE